jgi:hypothetical protein
VHALDAATSLAFLERATGRVNAVDRPAVDRVIDRTGGVILALTVVVGVRRAGSSWAETADRLERPARVFGGYAHADVFASMSVALDALPRRTRSDTACWWRLRRTSRCRRSPWGGCGVTAVSGTGSGQVLIAPTDEDHGTFAVPAEHHLHR